MHSMQCETKTFSMQSYFDRFWDAYPRKVAKKVAQQAWLKLKIKEDLFVEIMNAIEKQKKSKQWKKDGGEFIPHPSTWLNQERWTDELQMEESEKPKQVRKVLNLDALK